MYQYRQILVRMRQGDSDRDRGWPTGWSRHQYAEFVRDQTVATWLSCHRRAFESFSGVPGRIIIDNAKCAITKACYYEPDVQRAYGECAEGYGFRIDACPPRDPLVAAFAVMLQKKGIVESGVW